MQRFLLPGLTKDVSFSLAPDPFGNPLSAVGLQAAPVNPHTVAVIAGDPGTGLGEGLYVYDDATQRVKIGNFLEFDAVSVRSRSGNHRIL